MGTPLHLRCGRPKAMNLDELEEVCGSKGRVSGTSTSVTPQDRALDYINNLSPASIERMCAPNTTPRGLHCMPSSTSHGLCKFDACKCPCHGGAGVDRTKFLPLGTSSISTQFTNRSWSCNNFNHNFCRKGQPGAMVCECPCHDSATKVAEGANGTPNPMSERPYDHTEL